MRSNNKHLLEIYLADCPITLSDFIREHFDALSYEISDGHNSVSAQIKIHQFGYIIISNIDKSYFHIIGDLTVPPLQYWRLRRERNRFINKMPWCSYLNEHGSLDISMPKTQPIKDIYDLLQRWATLETKIQSKIKD